MKPKRTWHSCRIYTADVDSLLLGCVEPILQELVSSAGPTVFWERHYLGGSHLRLRIQAEHPAGMLLFQELVARAGTYIQGHPSAGHTTYRADRAAELLKWEGRECTAEDARYRVDTIEIDNYASEQRQVVSEQAEELIEDFLADARPLALLLIQSADRLSLALQMFWYEALYMNRDLRCGAISYKSHWEFFATFFEHQAFVRLVERNYAKAHRHLNTLLTQTMHLWEGGAREQPEALRMWRELLQRYDERVARGVATGESYTRQMQTHEDVARGDASHRARALRPSRFLQSLFAAPDFLLSFSSDASVIVPRVLVNLQYNLMSLANITMLERQSLCFYAHRAVEDQFEVDLTDVFLAGQTAPVTGERSA